MESYVEAMRHGVLLILTKVPPDLLTQVPFLTKQNTRENGFWNRTSSTQEN